MGASCRRVGDSEGMSGGIELETGVGTALGTSDGVSEGMELRKDVGMGMLIVNAGVTVGCIVGGLDNSVEALS